MGVTTGDGAAYFEETGKGSVREYPVDDGQVTPGEWMETTVTSLEGYVNANSWRFINQLIVDELDENRVRYDLEDLGVDYG